MKKKYKILACVEPEPEITYYKVSSAPRARTLAKRQPKPEPKTLHLKFYHNNSGKVNMQVNQKDAFHKGNPNYCQYMLNKFSLTYPNAFEYFSLYQEELLAGQIITIPIGKDKIFLSFLKEIPD